MSEQNHTRSHLQSICKPPQR